MPASSAPTMLRREGMTAARKNDATPLFLGPWYRKGPFFEASKRHGAKAYSIYNHTYLPTYHADPVEEYWKLLRDVTLCDNAGERQVEITGHEAFAFTNLLTTRDLTQCPVGQCVYALLTDETGGIVNDPLVSRLGENHFWLSLADSDALLWAKGVAVFAGMTVQVREPDVSPLQIQGPRSKRVVETLFGDEAAALPFYHLLETKLDDIPVVVIRCDESGELGFMIYLRDGSRGDELWERVIEAGRPHGIVATGEPIIRWIESGALNYGSDMNIENNPYEVGLGDLVDLDTDADFIGKRALKQIRAAEVSRKLVGFAAEYQNRGDWFSNNWAVRENGILVGRVTVAVYSPRLEKTVGYVWVPSELAGLGTTLSLETPDGPQVATVVPKPFIEFYR
jgi:glycine cleavage system aminomethyltransferase T